MLSTCCSVTGVEKTSGAARFMMNDFLGIIWVFELWIIVLRSKKGTEKHYRIESQCSYADILKRAPTFSIRNKCTNYMIKCVLCGMDMWSYNADKHYSLKHSDVECPIFVGQDEKNALLKSS